MQTRILSTFALLLALMPAFLSAQTCDEISAGTLTFESLNICFGDTLEITNGEDAVLPQGLGGEANGYAITVHSAPIMDPMNPLAEESFLGLFGIQETTFNVNFINDGTAIPPGTYYFSPVAMAGGVFTDPNGTFALLDFSAGCILAGESFEVNLLGDGVPGLTASVEVTPDTDPSMGGAVATVTAEGGSDTYTYAWSNGETTAMVDSLAPGTYTVTVSTDNPDNISCWQDISLTVTVVVDGVVDADECETAPDFSDLFNQGPGVSTISSELDLTGSTVNQATDPLNLITCWTDNQGAPSIENGIWVTFTPENDGIFNIVTNVCNDINPLPNNDTQFQLLSGTCGNFEAVACAEDQSASDFSAAILGVNLVGGTQYFLFIDGWQGEVGVFCIEVTEVDVIGCDQIASGTIMAEDNVLCFGDTMVLTVDGEAVIPTGQGGDFNGYATAVSTTDISNSEQPFAEQSFLGLFGPNATSGGVTFVHDGDPLAPATYYFTPVSAAGGVYTDPSQTFALLDFANGCISAGTSVEVVYEPEYGTVNVNLTSEDEIDEGSNGSATANVSGGSGDFSYEWSNGETTAMITDLVAGTYTVTITDLNECVDAVIVDSVVVDAISATIDPVFDAAVQVFPNPATDQVNLRYDFGNATNLEVSISNSLGQVVLNRDLSNVIAGSLRFDVSQLAAGVYNLRITDGERLSVKPLVIK